MSTTTKTETLAELKATMVFAPDWLREMIDERGDSALVEVQRTHYAFGTFITGVQEVPA